MHSWHCQFQTWRLAATGTQKSYGLSVELIWLAEALPLSKIAPELEGSHQVHAIFKSGLFVDNLDEALKELKSQNVTFAFEPFFDEPMQCRMFAIRDNNGNILQFFGK